jgi:hypothetical protein
MQHAGELCLPKAHLHKGVRNMHGKTTTARSRGCLSTGPSLSVHALERVKVFKYLGRMMVQDDNNVQAMRHQLRKARGTWACVGQVLRRENVTPQLAAKFYKAVVQAVLLYGSKTWTSQKLYWHGLRGSMFEPPTAWCRFIGQGGWPGTNGYTQRRLMSWRNVAWPQCSTTYRHVGLR